MEQSINVNFQNLTEEEKETLLKLCKKSQKKEAKKGLWIPKRGEMYYYINSNGTINPINLTDDIFSDWNLINNNYFKTKEEAKFELEKRKVLYELRKFATENNTEEIDWDDTRQEKNYFYYSYKNKCLCVISVWSVRDIHNIYFTSEKICYKAIKIIGEDRIKKYLFDVE